MSEASRRTGDDPASTTATLLRRGSRGPDVTSVQRQLRDAGYNPGAVDGIYGGQTVAAVRKLQAAHKVSADGIVGPETRRLLAELAVPAQPAPARKAATREPPTPDADTLTKAAPETARSAKAPPETAGPARKTARAAKAARPAKAARAAAADEGLREIQRALAAAGFDPRGADGLYGPNTAGALRTFQLVHGLDATGRADAETTESLLNRRLRLSGSVAAVARAATGPLAASDLLSRILAQHKEYGGGVPVVPSPEPSEVRLDPYAWLAHVRALFPATAAPELHGRLVVLGLVLLDAGLAVRLRDDLFEAVARELTEPLDALLTPRGDRLLGLMRAPTGSRDADRWRRLSQGSRAALAYADGLSRADGRDEVHMEHLAAGLDRDELGPLRRLLDRAGVGREDFAAALAQAAGHPLPAAATPTDPPALPPLSRHAGIAVEHGYRLAEAVGSDTVSRRHLLHGVLSVDECGLVKGLAVLGVHAADVDGWQQPTTGAAPAAVRPMLLADPAADTVPEPGEGRVRAADRLGTAAEVEVLASVLLARDTPLPLAIGLFGDWGSGKSFFMAHMQERIAELADLAKKRRPDAAPFCREVRQVRFNAWHYVDSNLWASLAASLFDQLARADARDKTQGKLDELDAARELAASAQRERERLEQTAREQAAKADGWRLGVTTSVAVAIHGVRHDRDLQAKLRKADTATDDDEPTERLIAALGMLEGLHDKARAAWRLFEEEVLHRKRRFTLVALAAVLVGTVGAAIATDWPALATAAASVGALAVALTPALNGSLRVLYLAREAREARELPLLKARERLADARLAEDEAKQQVADRERELAELRDRGLQLQQYVRQRATSPDYRDQLGVISKVRRDFEELVALLPGSGPPAGAEQVRAAAAALTEHVPQVERIILYIDDLDRCPHAKVVDVLQAVHLLLAFKLFVVVVGVDSRWLERSLRAHYGSLLEAPESYLEKIFQIPFTLRRMSVSRYRALIDQLTPAAPPTITAHPNPTGDGSEPLGPTATAAGPGAEATSHPAGAVRGPAEGAGADDAGPAPEPAEPPLPRPEALVISDRERMLLRELGTVVATPRAAKRMVNIYRMLRVSVRDDELDAFRPDGGGEYQAVVLLVAVLVGRAAMAEAFFLKVIDAGDDDDIWQIISTFPELTDGLTPLYEPITLRRAAPYRRWAPRVARFSLRLMAVLPAADDPVETPPGRRPHGSRA
jgi:peptidoglycan hydrolase-like protein with peptidoglycan-binding domain